MTRQSIRLRSFLLVSASRTMGAAFSSSVALPLSERAASSRCARPQLHNDCGGSDVHDQPDSRPGIIHRQMALVGPDGSTGPCRQLRAKWSGSFAKGWLASTDIIERQRHSFALMCPLRSTYTRSYKVWERADRNSLATRVRAGNFFGRWLVGQRMAPMSDFLSTLLAKKSGEPGS